MILLKRGTKMQPNFARRTPLGFLGHDANNTEPKFGNRNVVLQLWYLSLMPILFWCLEQKCWPFVSVFWRLTGDSLHATCGQPCCKKFHTCISVVFGSNYFTPHVSPGQNRSETHFFKHNGVRIAQPPTFSLGTPYLKYEVIWVRSESIWNRQPGDTPFAPRPPTRDVPNFDCRVAPLHCSVRLFPGAKCEELWNIVVCGPAK